LPNPDKYPLVDCAKVLDEINYRIESLSKAKKNLKDSIISRMKADNATILPYGDKLFRLALGKIVPTKGLEEDWIKAGFELLEVGDFVFKPFWSKAKEVKKLGGKKAELIDQYFVRLTETLEEK
jgi:hypothetical protein